LADFHTAFHLFCKGKFSADFLYPECCHEFSLLNKELNIHEKSVVVEDTSFNDQEIGDLQNDKLSVDAFDIVPNAFTILDCHEDQIIHFEDLKDDEQISKSVCDSFRYVVKVEQSTFNTEISEGSQQLKYNQLEQRHREVSLYGFNDYCKLFGIYGQHRC
jgi:hypothetical protein